MPDAENKRRIRRISYYDDLIALNDDLMYETNNKAAVALVRLIAS